MVNILVKLFNQIIETEIVPTDWYKMIILQTHKKRDRSVPANYTPLSFHSIPDYVACKILLERMSEVVTATLIVSKFGFCTGRDKQMPYS